MSSSGLLKYAGFPVALALCSACAGGPAASPSNAGSVVQYIGRTAVVNGRMVTAARPNVSALPRFMSIVPDSTAKSKYYEYTINFYGTYASIFDYPKSVNQIGTIENVGGQGCTNVLYGYGKKTFWIVAGQ